jgi:hypothetical protein
MRHLEFTDIFGINATQSATDIAIKKTDFPQLTPLATNNGEQILAAVLFNLLQYFEGTIVDGDFEPICIKFNGVTEELLYEEFSDFENICVYKYASLEPTEYVREISSQRFGLEDLMLNIPPSRIRIGDRVLMINIVLQHCIPMPSQEELSDRVYRHLGGLLDPDNIKPCILPPQWN